MCNEREPDYYRAAKDVDGVWLIRDPEHRQVGDPLYHEDHALDVAAGLNWARRLRLMENSMRSHALKSQPAVRPCAELGAGMGMENL